MKAILPVDVKHKPIEIWFQDESRVGQQGGLSYIWAKKGTRPQVKRDMRFDYAYIFGAICPERGECEALVLPRCNSEGMNKHLEIISKAVKLEAHAVLIVDGAGWHRSKELKIPENITLMHLPPYSPQLMPVENIWQYLKANYLNNRIFKDYNEILKACCDAWKNVMMKPELIKSIGIRKWAKSQSV
jgi:transposase